MNQDQIVYKRTSLGNKELMARHSDLGPVLNSLLVLVNGRATREDLMTLVTRLGAPANSRSMLETGGVYRTAGLRWHACRVARQ